MVTTAFVIAKSSPILKNPGNFYLVGLFSICSKANYKKNNITVPPIQIEDGFRRKALFFHLTFERNYRFMNKYFFSLLNYGTVSFDVCEDKDFLTSTITSLLIGDDYNGFDTHTKKNFPRIAVFYSYMTIQLTQLAGQLLSNMVIPFIIINDKQDQNILPESLFHHTHRLRTPRTNSLKLKRFFDTFQWHSVVILTLTKSSIYEEVGASLYEVLSKDRRYCVLQKSAYTNETISELIKILKDEKNLKLIHALGNIEDTSHFLDILDKNSILDRVLMIDEKIYPEAKKKEHVIPERLRKGIFFRSTFEDPFTPKAFKYDICQNVWYRGFDDQNNSTCSNITQLLWQNMKHNISLDFIQMFDHAISTPLLYAFAKTSWSTLDITRHTIYQTNRLLLVQGFFISNIYNFTQKPYFIITKKNSENSSFYRNKLENELTWPGNMTQSPIILCENNRVAPPGHYQVFDEISDDETNWDKEIGWFYRRCEAGYIKSSYGNASCKKCSLLTLPNFQQSVCYDPYSTICPLNVKTTEGILLCALLILGIVINLFFMVCFVWKRSTALVKSSQFVLSLSQFTTHLIVFLFILFGLSFSTNSMICAATPIIIGISFSLNLGITYVKTQIVVWIFQSGQKFSKGQKVKQKSFNAVFVIATAMCSILLSVVTMSSEISQPYVIHYVDTFTRFQYCSFGNHLQVQYIYVIFLSIVCTVQSFRARRLPESFKSTRFILYAMFTQLMIMFSMFTLYHTQNQDKYRQVYVLMYATIMTNCIVMGVVHANKVFDVMNKNTNNALHVRSHIQRNIKKQQKSINKLQG